MLDALGRILETKKQLGETLLIQLLFLVSEIKPRLNAKNWILWRFGDFSIIKTTIFTAYSSTKYVYVYFDSPYINPTLTNDGKSLRSWHLKANNLWEFYITWLKIVKIRISIAVIKLFDTGTKFNLYIGRYTYTETDEG